MSNNNPKISIITVSYNAAKTIEQTILSVVEQTYSNIEYIIIDGGSTDGTVDIIKKYEDRITYWVSEPDKGIYDAMNKGIDVATGDWVYFLCSGDLLCDDALNYIFLERDLLEYHLIYGKVFMKDIDKVYGKKMNKYIITRGNMCQQGVFYQKKLFSVVGKHDLQFRYLADWELNIRCFANDNIKKIFVDKIVALYEGNGASVLSNDYRFWAKYNTIIFKNFGYKVFIITYVMNFILDKLYGAFIIRKLRDMYAKLFKWKYDE